MCYWKGIPYNFVLLVRCCRGCKCARRAASRVRCHEEVVVGTPVLAAPCRSRKLSWCLRLRSEATQNISLHSSSAHLNQVARATTVLLGYTSALEQRNKEGPRSSMDDSAKKFS